MSQVYLALCCTIKDEPYLEEYIIYYYLLGVEHFYIYDNESTIPIKTRLNSFFYNKMCTVIDFPGKCQQMNVYNHCIKNFGPFTEWLIIADGDEYILPKKDNKISDFLKIYDHLQAVAINWVIFGSSYHNVKQDGFLIDKFRHCENKQYSHVKSIIKPKYAVNCDNPHFVWMQDMQLFRDCKNNIINSPFASNDNFTIDEIQMNHYAVKSYEDVVAKHYRGNADSYHRNGLPGPDPNEVHKLFNDIIDNTLPDKYLNMIKRVYKFTQLNLEIYKALNPDIKDFTYDEVVNHIISYGIIENRPAHVTDKYPDFNRNDYRSLHPHLAHLDDVHLEINFIQNHNHIVYTT